MNEMLVGDPSLLNPSGRTTAGWPEDAPPSRLEIRLAPKDGGTELTMVHSEVPAEQADSYRQGWLDHYWEPQPARPPCETRDCSRSRMEMTRTSRS